MCGTQFYESRAPPPAHREQVMATPVKRSILGEVLQCDLEEDIDDACDRMAERKPTHAQLRKRGFIQKDWNDHMNGFQAIKRQAQNCLVSEYSHYKRMVRMHESLAATTFGLECSNGEGA